MAISNAVSLANLASDDTFVVDNVNDRVGINSAIPTEALSVVGVVSATSFFGDGSDLSGITAGATLSAGSGDQRIVVTSLTSGTMTAAATDAELSYNSGTNTLSATNFSGSASGLTDVPSGQLSGALPAIDGSALTNIKIPAGFTELDAALFN